MINSWAIAFCGLIWLLGNLGAQLLAQTYPKYYNKNEAQQLRRGQFEFSEFSSQNSNLYLSLEEALAQPIQNVKRLRLSGKQLEAIPNKVFELTYLEELDLSFNNIKAIPAELIQLYKLKSLNISHNQIESPLIDSTFWQNKQLESLWLNHNRLDAIPEAIGNLSELRYLNLSHNQIFFGSSPGRSDYLGLIVPYPEVGTTYPRTFLHKVQAQEVITNISQRYQISVRDLMRINQLEKPILRQGQVLRIPILINPFPEKTLKNGYWVVPFTAQGYNAYSYNGFCHLGKLRQLEYLDLSHNQINYLPWSFYHLSRLKVLNLNHNQLKELPWEIQGLKSLEYLFLSYNQFDQLPDYIGKLENLASLHLDYNFQKNVGKFSISDEIIQLKKLTRLHLSGNKMDEFPIQISTLVNLKRLTLADANLYTLPPDIRNLTQLSELHLQENALEELPSEMGELNSLRKLFLQKNILKSLPSQLNNLTNLDT
ncbi:MAG: leucine-rich repeat domain-containing protein, partial [Bacteroidota bacterium]